MDCNCEGYIGRVYRVISEAYPSTARSRITSSFLCILLFCEFCLPLGVDVQDTFFDSGRKCVAMVTAYYTIKKYCGAGVLITFSDISSFIWNCLSIEYH